MGVPAWTVLLIPPLCTAPAAAVDLGPEKTYVAANDLGQDCTVIENDYCRLYYPPGLPEDGKLMKAHLKNAVSRLVAEFPEFEPERLLKRDMDCRMYVYDKPNEKASDYLAQVRNGTTGDKYVAEMYFLAPSKHPPDARDSIGRVKDKDYFSYLVAHEYSSIILDRITRRKNDGWTIYESPDWFNQGYEQYLGLKSSPIGKETFDAYIRNVRKDPRRITSSSYGLSVQDRHEDGALLLKFMHEAFGAKKVHALLSSRKSSFYAAMESVIGPKDVFMKEWAKWLKKQ